MSKSDKVKEYIEIVKAHGIHTVGDFLFGFDAHDEHIFQETLDFVKSINIDEVYPHLVIPFPGSVTYKKLKDEGRIFIEDWSKYEGGHAVFKPVLLSPTELEEGL